ncbi:hypothetical protein SUDANB95_03230 [Actinosynnema sp. ALI-1.44]
MRPIPCSWYQPMPLPALECSVRDTGATTTSSSSTPELWIAPFLVG